MICFITFNISGNFGYIFELWSECENFPKITRLDPAFKKKETSGQEKVNDNVFFSQSLDKYPPYKGPFYAHKSHRKGHINIILWTFSHGQRR